MRVSGALLLFPNHMEYTTVWILNGLTGSCLESLFPGWRGAWVLWQATPSPIPPSLLILSPLFPHPGVKSPSLGTKWSSYCRRASSRRRKLTLRMTFIVRESLMARRAGMMGPWGRRAAETAWWVSSYMETKASLPKLGEEWHAKRQLEVEDQKDSFPAQQEEAGSWVWETGRAFREILRFGGAAGKLVLHHVTSSSIVYMPREWALEKAIHVSYHWDEEEVHQDYNNKVFFFNSLRKLESHKRCGLVSVTEGTLEGLWSNTSYLKGMLEDSLKSKRKKYIFSFKNWRLRRGLNGTNSFRTLKRASKHLVLRGRKSFHSLNVSLLTNPHRKSKGDLIKP